MDEADDRIINEGGKRKALIISVSNYDNLDNLDFCKKDGEETYTIFKEKLGFDIPDERKITDNRVDYLKMHDTIINFYRYANTNADDTLLFYYSGHGVPDNNFNMYLASSEIDPNVPSLRGFPFDELTNSMNLSTCKRVVTILDCCHSGELKLGKGTEEDAVNVAAKAMDNKSKMLKEGEGKCILAASLGAQRAYDLREEGLSIFTYYLLEGLKRKYGDSVNTDGNVTVFTLGNFIYDTIVNLPEDKRPKQNPLIKVEGGGDIILALYQLPKPKLEDLLKLLHDGKIEEFNKIRKDTYILLDFHDVNLNGLNLQGVDLSEANVRGANLKDAKFSTANLTKADLQGANLTRADLQGANLTRADLQGATLTDAILKGAILAGKDLRGTNIQGADLQRANLFNARLSGANLGGANLSFAALSHGNLYGANLSHAILKSTNLYDANLTRANLSYAIISEFPFTGRHFMTARYARSRRTIFQLSADIDDSDIDLSKSHSISADLSDADIGLANLSFSIIIGLNDHQYRGLKCHDADFSDAIICDEDLVKYLKDKQAKNVPPAITDKLQLQNKLQVRNLKSDRIKELMETYAEVLYYKGCDRLEENSDYEEAIKCYNEVLEIVPNHIDALNKKGLALHNLHKYEEAIKCYDNAIAIDANNAQMWDNKGFDLIELNKYEEAIKCYDNSIRLNSDRPKPWQGKGLALHKLKKYDEAIASYDKAIEIEPNDAFLWNGKGDILYDLNKYDEAIASYDKAIEIEPNDPFLWIFKAFALSELKRYDEVIECYDKALNIESNLPFVWYNRACYKVKKGDIENGIADLKKAIEIGGNTSILLKIIRILKL